MSGPNEMTVEEAIVRGRELLRSLGGSDRLALERLIRVAERSRKPSSTNMKAVEHFRAAAEIAKGEG